MFGASSNQAIDFADKVTSTYQRTVAQH